MKELLTFVLSGSSSNNSFYLISKGLKAKFGDNVSSRLDGAGRHYEYTAKVYVNHKADKEAVYLFVRGFASHAVRSDI